MKKERLILIGNGMAGIQTIEELLKKDPDRYDISVFGDEPYTNYNRIMLSNVLVEKATFEETITHDREWYAQHQIDLYTSEKVLSISTEDKSIATDRNRSFSFDKLIIATGSTPFMLPLPGIEKEGIIPFRSIDDCKNMIDASKHYKKAVVIGAGLLGLEAARGLMHLGMDVEVVHISSSIMNQQLDEEASSLLQQTLEQKGFSFLLNKETVEILGEKRVTGVRFQDGTETKADLVVMAIGIRPNIALVTDAKEIFRNRGILVDDFMETTVPGIFAVGECTEHRAVTYGLVAPLFEQASVLARVLTGDKSKRYEGSLLSAKLKVSDVDVFSVGQLKETEETKTVRLHNELLGIYKKIVMKNEVIVGAVLFGDTQDSRKISDYIKQKTPVAEFLHSSIFSSGKSTESPALTLQDDDIVCGCNGVSKKMITDAIGGGCTTFDDIKSCTKAARSCGGCASLVQHVLQDTMGDAFEGHQSKTPVCSCTTLEREELIEQIKERGLTHSKEIRMVLGWTNPDGCSKCRPALNYYLGMLYPLDHQDEAQSRAVNERMHANIQKDGTYGVVPRMYGGVTNPKDLKRIAEVAEKYNVPLVKVTGAQRLNLLGVKKEDLPKIWADLDMPSGYAYGKSLRMVKTCVGAGFCRFGTVDSMGLGVRLEKKYEGLQTPHKIKLAVSACPRNCAESGIKDVGIVGLDGVWEMYVGGNAGVDLRGADLLYKVKTEEELIELISAFLQYYRESAKYLERTSYWVERTGIDHIRSVLDDPAQRKALVERMETALSTHEDPWKKLIEDEKAKNNLFAVTSVDDLT